MKRRFLVIAILIALIGGSIWWFTSGNEETSYLTEPVTRGDIARTITATGRINPKELVSVGTQVSGNITKILVQPNDQVKKGQLLAEIDPVLLQAQLDQSKSSMDNAYYVMELAQRDLERSQSLFQKKYIAQTELERAEQAYRNAVSSYNVSKAQYDRDKANVEYTHIRSPIDGVVIQMQVSAGQTMAANFQTPELFKIAGDLRNMVIDVSLTEADIGQVEEGMEVRFTVDAYPQKEFTGTVTSINLNANTTADITTYSVLVSVDNEEKLLLPGMTAYASIVLSESKDVLRVPAAALRFQPPVDQGNGLKRLFGLESTSYRSYRWRNQNTSDEQTVYVLAQGKPKRVVVTTGSSDEISVEITGGELQEGDAVITGTAMRDHSY